MKRLTGLETTVASAYGIDSLGRVVGHLGESAAPRAFRWQAGILTKLGTLGGPTSKALAINNAGKIVGWSTKASGTPHAFLWQNGTMTDLGTLGGSTSEATDINKPGQVTGSAATATGQEHAFVWKGGVMSDMGQGQSQGLNDSGWVVRGRIDRTVSGNGGYLPTLWRPQHATGPAAAGPRVGRQQLLRQQPQPQHQPGGGHDPGGDDLHLDLGDQRNPQRAVHRHAELSQQCAHQH